MHSHASPIGCANQMLLAELDLRNIRLHERVTEALVNQRYKFGRPLGQGSSAMVYEARHKRTGREVAVKVIKKDDDMNDDESMTTELEILKVVHHRYILNCHELFETDQCVWVVMELIGGGELLEVLIEGGVYTERDAARAMKQAFLAISYLHSQGVVHRDVSAPPALAPRLPECLMRRASCRRRAAQAAEHAADREGAHLRPEGVRLRAKRTDPAWLARLGGPRRRQGVWRAGRPVGHAAVLRARDAL